MTFELIYRYRTESPKVRPSTGRRCSSPATSRQSSNAPIRSGTYSGPGDSETAIKICGAKLDQASFYVRQARSFVERLEEEEEKEKKDPNKTPDQE